MNDFLIETTRLQLELLSADDAAFTLELLNEPGFIHNIGDRGVRTLDQARDYLLSKPIDSYVKNGYGLCRVSLKSSGDVIGMCGLVKRDALEHPDLGYALLKKFHGQGYAHEAALAVRNFSHAVLGHAHILALTKPGNRDSEKVLLKLDFRNSGLATLLGVKGESFLWRWQAV